MLAFQVDFVSCDATYFKCAQLLTFQLKYSNIWRACNKFDWFWSEIISFRWQRIIAYAVFEYRCAMGTEFVKYIFAEQFLRSDFETIGIAGV